VAVELAYFTAPPIGSVTCAAVSASGPLFVAVTVIAEVAPTRIDPGEGARSTLVDSATAVLPHPRPGLQRCRENLDSGFEAFFVGVSLVLHNGAVLTHPVRVSPLLWSTHPLARRVSWPS